MSEVVSNKLPGLTISVPLFFDQENNIDFNTLERYLHDICQNKHISAIYSMAYNTRYRMLSDKETLEVNSRISKFVKSYKKTIYVGHPYIFTENSLRKYFNNIKKAEPDGISMLYPERFYEINTPIIKFLKMPNEYGLGTVLHEMKLVSGFDGTLVNWSNNLLEEVFETVPLIAIKEDSKDDEMTIKILSLSSKYNVHCVLAGGGKRRAMQFIDKGLQTWLNGSTMFLPKLIDETYISFINHKATYTQWYLEKIEDPFFKNIVSKVGWHLAHKAALQYFGYGFRYERFPHPMLDEEKYKNCTKTFSQIKAAVY